jgi:hypothetical protein
MNVTAALKVEGLKQVGSGSQVSGVWVNQVSNELVLLEDKKDWE